MFLMDGGFANPSFGCSPIGDWGCYVEEGMAKVAISAIVGMGNFAADTIVNAFDQPITKAQWLVAFNQWGMWAAIVLPFVAIAMLWQIAIGLITMNRRRIATAVIGGTLSIPLSAAAVWLMATLVGAIDGSSQQVVDTIQGGKLGGALISTIGLDVNTGDFKTNSAIHQLVNESLASNSIEAIVPAFFLMLLTWIGGLFLVIAMDFRDHGLLLLAALAPMALMFLGQGRLSSWSEKWFSIVAGLALMKPIVIGIITATIALGGMGGIDKQTPAQLLVAILLIFFCAFAPFWVVKLADFTGGEFAMAIANRPSIRAGGARVTALVNNKVTQALSGVLKKALGRAA